MVGGGGRVAPIVTLAVWSRFVGDECCCAVMLVTSVVASLAMGLMGCWSGFLDESCSETEVTLRSDQLSQFLLNLLDGFYIGALHWRGYFKCSDLPVTMAGIIPLGFFFYLSNGSR